MDSRHPEMSELRPTILPFDAWNWTQRMFLDERHLVLSDSPRGLRKRCVQKRRTSDVMRSDALNEIAIRSSDSQELPKLGLEYEKTISAYGLKAPAEQGLSTSVVLASCLTVYPCIHQPFNTGWKASIAAFCGFDLEKLSSSLVFGTMVPPVLKLECTHVERVGLLRG